MDFDDLLIPGTNRYDKKALSRIGLDTSQSRIYKPEYIAGFIAEKIRWVEGCLGKRQSQYEGHPEGNISNHIRRTCHADQVSSQAVHKL